MWWLEQGKLALRDILPLLSDPETKLSIRIGIGAIMEHYEGTPAIRQLIPGLADIVPQADLATRIDLCHYLSLTHSKDVTQVLTALLADRDRQVCQAAQEGLDEL